MQNLKILAINFEEEDASNLFRKINKLGFKFSSDLIKGKQRITKAHVDKDYDLVFLYIPEFQRNYGQLISETRSKFALAEFIIISPVEDYELAVKAMRSGARDIITLPIESDSLNVSIRTAYSYRHAYFTSEKYSKLLAILNHFGDIRKFTSQLELFLSVEKYVTQHFPVKGVSVFHYNFEKKISEFDYGEDFKVELEHKDFKDLSSGEEDYIVKDSRVYICFFSGANNGYILTFKVPKDYEFYKVDLVFAQLSSVIKNSYEFLLKHKSEAKMSSLAHTDDVTGLYNQRKLYKDIDKNIERAKENNSSFSLVFLDLDNFKNINDGHGHVVGSNLLLQVAQVIRRVIRDTDFIYRYGGDEFVIILPTAKALDAKRIGERLLSVVKSHSFEADNKQTFSLSTSIGIAEYPRDATSRDEILKIADKMMYEAKKTGRGRVCLIEEIFSRQEKSG